MAVGNLFNEQWYLQNHPDVAEAVQQGVMTAFEHFQLFGMNEGRAPGPLFDPDHYLAQNPDVAAAVEAGLMTAYEHFEQFGAHESRSPVPYFDVEFYLLQNPDIAAAVEQGLISATEHFLQFGQGEPRAISPFFDLAAYMAANPDVAEAVAAGLMSPLGHLLTNGFAEGRDLGNGVSLAQFQNDPVFQNAINQGGSVFDVLNRVAEVAPFLPSFQPPPGWTPAANTPIPVDFVPPQGTTLVIPPSVEVPPGTELPGTFVPPPSPPAPPPPAPPTPPAPPAPDPGPGEPAPDFFVHVSEVGGETTVSFSGSATGNIALTVDDAGRAVFTRQTVSATEIVQFDADDLVNIHLAATDKVVVSGSDLDSLNVNFTGTGTVDITGVGIGPSVVEEGESQFASVSADLYKVLLPNAHARLHAPDSAPFVAVNGGEADFIKASWVYFDRQYYEGWPATWVENYYDLDLSQAKADLALLYIQYLEDGGDAAPFLAFVAKTAVSGSEQSRSQSVHDNILGEVSAASLNDRFGGPDRADLREAYFEQAGEFTDRPWVSGSFSDAYNAQHRGALVFDYGQGWERADFIHYPVSDRLDDRAIEGGNEMYMGDGNTVVNFNLARHEGAGIELALKAKPRATGFEYDIDDSGGIVVYEAQAGPADIGAGWGTPAAWSFDFSVAAGLNGAETGLDDFDFSIFVDINPTDAVDFIEFRLLKPGDIVLDPEGAGIDLGRSWVQMTPDGEYALDESGVPVGAFGYELHDVPAVNEVVSQNSVNFGFEFLRDLLAEYDYVNGEGDGDQDAGFGPALFDIKLEAYGDDAELLVGNHMRVQVSAFEPV